jgi:guanylate kinase
MKPKLLCILGETASGKDSVVNGAIKLLSDYNIRPVCSYTGRPRRSYETNGVEHYFVSTEEFFKLKEKRGCDILGYTHIKNDKSTTHPGYYYMALSDELDTAQIYIIDYKGLQYLQEKYGNEIDIVTVYIHATPETRRRRAQASRSDFLTEFEERMKAEEAQFREFRNKRLYDYRIDNETGKLENSINRLMVIMKYELIRADVPNCPQKISQKTNS